MAYGDANEIIEKPFDLLFSRYQIGLETQLIRSDVIFDCVNFFYYKCHKINFKWGVSYTDSLDWIKKKKTAINPKIDDDDDDDNK